jgi:hypothetical protein
MLLMGPKGILWILSSRNPEAKEHTKYPSPVNFRNQNSRLCCRRVSDMIWTSSARLVTRASLVANFGSLASSSRCRMCLVKSLNYDGMSANRTGMETRTNQLIVPCANYNEAIFARKCLIGNYGWMSCAVPGGVLARN